MLTCVQEWVGDLAANNQSWVPIVDPGIMVDLDGYEPYQLGMEVSIAHLKRHAAT